MPSEKWYLRRSHLLSKRVGKGPDAVGGGGHRAGLGHLAQIVPLDEGGGPAWSGAPPRVEGGDHPA